MADAAAAPAIQVINPANLRGILSTPQTDIPLFYGDPSKDRLQSQQNKNWLYTKMIEI